MSDFQALGSAIFAALGGTAATPPAYQWLAPQGSTPPYTVFAQQAALDDYTFGTAHGLSADYVIKVVSNRRWPQEAQTAYGSVHASVQDAVLAVTGWRALRCRRRSTVEYQDGDGFWHVGGIYAVEIVT